MARNWYASGGAFFPRCPCTSGDSCHTPAAPWCGETGRALRPQVLLSRRCGRAVLDMPEMHVHEGHLVAVRGGSWVVAGFRGRLVGFRYNKELVKRETGLQNIRQVGHTQARSLTRHGRRSSRRCVLMSDLRIERLSRLHSVRVEGVMAFYLQFPCRSRPSVALFSMACGLGGPTRYDQRRSDRIRAAP
jgi:hypothetical protein